MASKAPQGTQVTPGHLARRAFQEKWDPQDGACQAPKASMAFLEMSELLGRQASQAPLAPQALQDK